MSSNVIMSGSLQLSSTNTPTRDGQRVITESDIANIKTPYVGMIIYIEDADKYVYVKSLKSKMVGTFEILNAQVDQYYEVFPKNIVTKVDKIEKDLLVINSTIKEQVDLAINDFTNAITDNGVIDTFKELVDFANSSNAGDLIITVNKVEQNIEIINQEVQQIKVDMSVIDSKVTSNTSSIENLDNKYTHILSWEQVD